MNLRTKFFWYSLLTLGTVAGLYFGYLLYGIYKEESDLWTTYNNESTGTDEDLSQKVREMETGFLAQANYKFKVTDIPTDLTKVIALDGLDFSNYGVSSVRFSAGIFGKNNHAIAHYHDKIFNIAVGDSIAGGVVTSITPTRVIFERDGSVFTHVLEENQLTNK